jgi:hypothetical protein
MNLKDSRNRTNLEKLSRIAVIGGAVVIGVVVVKAMVDSAAKAAAMEVVTGGKLRIHIDLTESTGKEHTIHSPI